MSTYKPVPVVGKEKKQSPAPPSLACFKGILRDVLKIGFLSWGRNFKAKCDLFQDGPGFNTVDALKTLRRGVVVLGPLYDAHYDAWKYEIADSVDGMNFVLDILLHCDSDYKESPRVTIRSGFFRRGQRRELRDEEKGNGQDDNETAE